MDLEIRASVGYSDEQIINDAFYVREAVFVIEQGFELENEVDDDDDSALHIVGYIDNSPVAVLRGLFKDVCTMKIGRVAVLSNYRGHKLGQKIMQFAEDYANNHDLRVLIPFK